MATYNFNPNGALDTADELAKVHTLLMASLDDLEVKIATFLTANEGKAPEVYLQAQSLWNEGQAQMSASIADGTKRLGWIHDNYLLGDLKGAVAFGDGISI
ncbi:hypothetical protein [Parafrankia elaeagni]|uniref:hypothetical protein n=1 Tax=Parafrankia elaeagni TaxID=222534 RepID=UPI00036FE854|nr:hypothetical protein [Parafrankia elaeagni]